MSYELIETIEVGAGGAASIEFTSIPQDGVDLLVVLSGRTTGASVVSAGPAIRFNNDSGSNYNQIELRGSGSAVTTQSSTSTFIAPRNTLPTSLATSNTFSNIEIYVSNYTSSSSKSVSIDGVMENNATESYQNITAANWTNTSSITTFSILIGGGESLVEFSTASLYKIS